MWRKQCEGLMCGDVQFEGAVDEGNARLSCIESLISTKKVSWGVTWKVMATMAPPLSRYTAFVHIAIVTSVFDHRSENIPFSGHGHYCKHNILPFSKRQYMSLASCGFAK